jgi:hypothetical protein
MALNPADEQQQENATSIDRNLNCPAITVLRDSQVASMERAILGRKPARNADRTRSRAALSGGIAKPR